MTFCIVFEGSRPVQNSTAFYLIGSVGFAVTGLLHILVALLTGNANLGLWLPLYLVPFTFMCIAWLQMLHAQRQRTRSGHS